MNYMNGVINDAISRFFKGTLMKFKNTLSLALLSLLLSISSCKNDSVQDNFCVEVSYNAVFEAVHGERYCLPDGAELVINDLVNAFCPCNIICAWEGEMQLNVSWTDASGTVQTGNVSTHPTAFNSGERDIGRAERQCGIQAYWGRYNGAGHRE